MTFSIEDYTHSIARIFFKDGQSVVGTGFLVAPGYVLTCAHVVLQAIGVSDEQEFSTYDTPPKDSIILDFPMSAGDQIKAEVIAWKPYKKDRDDIAGLKLTMPAPLTAAPVPVIRRSYEDIKDESLSVYGFPDFMGDLTHAYKVKSDAPGGRFQLYKAGDNPPDETIQAGFSGAPVWNDQRKAVIGMVATAAISTDQRSKAYAISGEELSPILQKLFAHSLYDSIGSHIGSNCQQIQHAIETAFWLCDTDGDQAKSDHLLDRFLYLGGLNNRDPKLWNHNGREIDRLTQFAMFLVVMDGLPGELMNEIAAWVKFRNFNFDALYVKANRYRQERQVSAAAASPHLVVQISPDEHESQNNVVVSIWVIDDRDSYNPLEPRLPLIRDRVVAFTALPTFLETWLQEESNLDNPMIHCFVARHLLGCNLDACETESGLTLGNQYKLVMRTDLNQSPAGKQYYTRWHNKWQSLHNKQQSVAREVFVRTDCSDKRQLYRQLHSAEMAILENLASEQVSEVFKFIADKMALPVALWVRQDELCQELDRVLDCPIMTLPDRVRDERLEAIDETCLGYHLSLVWEDPKVIPPTWDMRFIQ